jgi:hypothetical protein
MDTTDPTTTNPTAKPHVAADKLLLGIALIGIGIAGFLGAIDVLHIRNLGKLWPVFLIVIGIGREIEAIRNRRANGGWILLAVGTWFLVSNFHLFDLTPREALPIGAIVAGAVIALHGVIDRPYTAKETRNEQPE